MSALVVNKHTPVDATAGAVSMTLPTGAASGAEISCEKYDTTTNTVTITGNIRGVAAQTVTMSLAKETVAFRADASGSWWPIAGHKTKSSLDNAYDIGTVKAIAARFPGIDLTGATDSIAGLQLAANAVPEGGTLIVPAGTYLCNGTLSNASGKSMTVVAYGATFIKGTDAALFNFTGGYDTPIAVTGIAAATITDDTTGSTPGTALTLASSPAWKRGDAVKVYADDVIPDGRAGSGGNESRIGQFLIVSNVTRTTVNCIGRLRETYTTNVRVARISDKAVHVRGGSYITLQSGLDGSWSTNMIQFRSMSNPTVKNIRIKSTAYAGLRFSGCYGYTVDGIDIDYAKNDQTNSIYGYGIQDASSAFGKISNYRARRVRHAYTDGTAFQAAATADPSNYGRTYGTQISSCTAYGTANTSWDTHSWSEGVTFSDVHSVDSYMGFSLRGKKHQVIDCTARDCYAAGLYVQNETSGESYGHYVRDFLTDSCTRPIWFDLHPTGHALAGVRETRQTLIDGLTIKGGDFESVYLTNATVRIDRMTWIAGATITGTNIVQLNNSTCEGQGWIHDTKQVTSGTGLKLAYLQTASELFVDDWKYVTVTANAGVTSQVVNADASTSLARVPRFTATHALSAGQSLVSGVGGESYIDWNYLSSDGQGGRWVNASGSAITSTTAGGAVSALSRTRAPHVDLRLDPTSLGADATLPALPASFVRGQRLTVWNAGTANNIILNNAGTTRLNYGSTRTLAPGDSITFVWTNTLWKQLPYDTDSSQTVDSTIAVGEATVPRQAVTTGSLAIVSGTLKLTFFTAKKSETVTNVRVPTGSTAAAATPTLARIGFYQVNSDGSLTLLASCANDTTLFSATNTAYTRALDSSVAKVVGTRYAIGVLVVTAAATPTFLGTLTATSLNNELALDPRLGALVTGQSDLPSSIASASLTNPTGLQYAVVRP